MENQERIDAIVFDLKQSIDDLSYELQLMATKLQELKQEENQKEKVQ